MISLLLIKIISINQLRNYFNYNQLIYPKIQTSTLFSLKKYLSMSTATSSIYINPHTNQKHWRFEETFYSCQFTPNISNYFQRIGYSSDINNFKPTLENLIEIQRKQAYSIPFENLDIHLGKPIIVEPALLEQKIISNKRGGYCFEVNTLLFYFLKALGYNVTPMYARVRWMFPNDVATGWTHLTLKVTIDNMEYLVDCGFGSGILTSVYKIHSTESQVSDFDTRRIIPYGRGFMFQILAHGTTNEWLDLYTFLEDPIYPVDCYMSNWWTSASPDSKFTKDIIVVFPGKDCRYSLIGREFTIRYFNGEVEKKFINDDIELLQVLEKYFCLSFPFDTKFISPNFKNLI